jgi:hypothetical protein
VIKKRIEQFERLCDIVYQKKGYTNNGVPKRETVIQFDLLDKQASDLLDEYNKQ